jgi:hypothetical protein
MFMTTSIRLVSNPGRIKDSAKRDLNGIGSEDDKFITINMFTILSDLDLRLIYDGR